MWVRERAGASAVVDIVVSPPLGACRQSVVQSSARRYCVDVPAGWVRFEARSGILFGGAWDEGGGRRHNTRTFQNGRRSARPANGQLATLGMEITSPHYLYSCSRVPRLRIQALYCHVASSLLPSCDYIGRHPREYITKRVFPSYLTQSTRLHCTSSARDSDDSPMSEGIYIFFLRLVKGLYHIITLPARGSCHPISAHIFSQGISCMRVRYPEEQLLVSRGKEVISGVERQHGCLSLIGERP